MTLHGAPVAGTVPPLPADDVVARDPAGAALSFEDPQLDWHNDDDPFAELGPVDLRPPVSGESETRPDEQR